MKYYVISDIHSCFDAVRAALNEAGYDPNDPTHMILFLGDAFDKGSQPSETYLFLKETLKNGKLIWLRGNHDDELIETIETGKFKRDNAGTARALAKQLCGNASENENNVCAVLRENRVAEWINDNTRDYFETEHYLFVHGFIPIKNGKYDPEWKKKPIHAGHAVRAMLETGIRIPGKTLVSGHDGCYVGHIATEHPDVKIGSPEWNKIKRDILKNKPRTYFEPYYGDGVIAIDAHSYETGFVNCIVIEDNENI